ncbi:MAG: ABC transporter ATP-binding protein [Planctomycetes bacterium]|nr:ABC transporter ATP-binding protein [Planctomycetota bacterium]
MNAIEVQGLGKAFGSRRVLVGIDLVVPAGQLLGLVGPNGAGKSTLLRSWIGLCRRDRGRVQVLGRDPAVESLAIRRRTCYLPGETGVYHQMTGAEFLAFAHGFYRSHRHDLLERLLGAFDLPLQQRVRSYSAGMKQKLALLATLVPDVDLYLLDEPDRALDASVRCVLRDALLELKAAGKSIVLSSHHLSELETIADRLEFLFAGRFVDATALQAARARLRHRLRLRLLDGTTLPAGARILGHEPDGTWIVEADGEPLDLLRSLPAAHLRAAEVGVVRLEDLYQVLEQTVPTATPGSAT